MIKKIPLRVQLTILNIVLLTFCCLGLTFVLNISADKMATKLDLISINPPIFSPDPSTENLPPSLISPEDDILPMTSTTESESARVAFKIESFIYMILIISIGGVLTYLISKKTLTPLSNLTNNIKNINVQNLSDNIPIPKKFDEVAELTSSFNDMTNKLNDAFSMQGRFASNAAHELKTPLTVIQTKVDVFKKKSDRTIEEYASLINTIESHTKRLSSLVKNLLDMTYVNEKDLNDSVNLRILFQNILNELSYIANEKNIGFKFNLPNIVIKGNEELLYCAFYNIIENAIKYNVNGGEVNVIIKAFDSKAVIEISDTGIGIPDSSKPLIFEAFYRVDKSRSRK
ncbi:MAG: sensor histidine kinase, partial [Clostridium sp.]